MKKLLLAGMVAMVGSSALAYDTNGQDPNQDQYIEQFHISWRDAHKQLNHYSWMISGGTTQEELATQRNFVNAFGDAHAYYQVFKADQNAADGLLETLWKEARNYKNEFRVSADRLYDALQDLQTEELGTGYFKAYNGDFGPVWEKAKIGNE